MRFSEAFGIQRGPEDDWFDPHLTVDTKLFVDPLLLLLTGPEWKAGHDELVAHFMECYRLIAQATSNSSPSAQAARRLFTFPEPFEFGLGYTAAGHGWPGVGEPVRPADDGCIAVAISADLEFLCAGPRTPTGHARSPRLTRTQDSTDVGSEAPSNKRFKTQAINSSPPRFHSN